MAQNIKNIQKSSNFSKNQYHQAKLSRVYSTFQLFSSSCWNSGKQTNSHLNQWHFHKTTYIHKEQKLGNLPELIFHMNINQPGIIYISSILDNTNVDCLVVLTDNDVPIRTQCRCVKCSTKKQCSLQPLNASMTIKTNHMISCLKIAKSVWITFQMSAINKPYWQYICSKSDIFEQGRNW